LFLLCKIVIKGIRDCRSGRCVGLCLTTVLCPMPVKHTRTHTLTDAQKTRTQTHTHVFRAQSPSHGEVFVVHFHSCSAFFYVGLYNMDNEEALSGS
jgi:hypothetical protein